MNCEIISSEGYPKEAAAVSCVLNEWHYGARHGGRKVPMPAFKLAQYCKGEYEMSLAEFRAGLQCLSERRAILAQHISGTLYVGFPEAVHSNFALMPTFRPDEDMTVFRDERFKKLFADDPPLPDKKMEPDETKKDPAVVFPNALDTGLPEPQCPICLVGVEYRPSVQPWEDVWMCPQCMRGWTANGTPNFPAYEDKVQA